MKPTGQPDSLTSGLRYYLSVSCPIGLSQGSETVLGRRLLRSLSIGYGFNLSRQRSRVRVGSSPHFKSHLRKVVPFPRGHKKDQIEIQPGRLRRAADRPQVRKLTPSNSLVPLST